VLVGLEILLVLDLRWRGMRFRVGLGGGLAAIAPIAPFGGDVDQRKHVGVDDAELGLRAELAAKQAHRFEVRVHVLAAAGNESRDEHALERRHIELRTDRRLDGDLEVAGAGGHRDRGDEATGRPCESCGH
jgi:hypothetical protein